MSMLMIILYAVEVYPLSHSDVQSLNFVLVHFLMKLFKTNKKDVINDCCTF